MAANCSKIMRIQVTGGDAIKDNRKSGKSNTGTYFITNTKAFEEDYKDYFTDEMVFYLDLKRIKIYRNSFINLFFSKRDEYPGHMDDFEMVCDSLLAIQGYPQLKFGLRINDTRVFLKFLDNNGMIESLLRSIIYSELTNICFEKNKNDECLVYLEVNTTMIDLPSCQSILDI